MSLIEENQYAADTSSEVCEDEEDFHPHLFGYNLTDSMKTLAQFIRIPSPSQVERKKEDNKFIRKSLIEQGYIEA